MKAFYRYGKLVERGRWHEGWPELAGQASLRAALQVLWRQAEGREGLAMGQPWRLDEAESAALEAMCGGSPPGGWDGLVGLAAGAGIVRGTDGRFLACPEGALRLRAWDEAEARRALLEAFTRMFIPPTTAAGLFLLLDVHPVWGLRLVEEIHREEGLAQGRLASWRDEALFAPEQVERVRRCCFDAIGALLGLLRSLDPQRSYPLEALALCVESCCLFGRQRQPAVRDSGPMSPFLGDGGLLRDHVGPRVLEYTLSDLFEGLLIPSGAARRFDDGTFAVAPGALAEVRAGRLAPEEQDALFAEMLQGDGARRAC